MKKSAIFLFINAVFFFYLARKNYLITIDTETYLGHFSHRTPGYPIFLDAMRLLAGGADLSGALRLAHITQLVIGFFASFWLARALMRRFSLPPTAGWLMHLLLLVPQFRCGEVIATESLSYSVLLLFLAALSESFFLASVRSVAGVSALLFMLLVIRPQFLFLVPLALPYLLWLIMARGRARRAALPLVGGAILMSFVAQAAYNYANHGRFAKIPFTGTQLLSVALYFATPESAPRLGDPAQAAYLAGVLSRIEAGRWHARHRPQHESYSAHFDRMYTEIFLRGVRDGYREMVGTQELTIDDWIALDRLALRISSRLLASNLRGLSFHILKQMQEVGGYMSLLMLLAIGLGAAHRLLSGEGGGLLLMAVGAMGIANYLLVGLVEPLAPRYLMYTENIQIPFLLAFCLDLIRRTRTAPPPMRLLHAAPPGTAIA